MPILGSNNPATALRFQQVAFEEKNSIEDATSECGRRGIYVYKFTNGTWYVGKTVNLPKRHLQHRHEYRHAVPHLTIEKMFFAPVRESEARYLDQAETDMIAWCTKKGFKLTNIMKTSRPGGPGSIEIGTGRGFGVDIPWERSSRPRGGNRRMVNTEQGDAPRKLEKLTKLEKVPFGTTS